MAKFTGIFEVTDLTHDGLPVVVMDDDLYEVVRENASDASQMELDELFDILDDWIFEGRN